MGKTLLLENEGFKPYNIVIEQDYGRLIESLRDIKKAEAKVCIISDSNVAPLHGEELKTKLLEYFGKVSLFVIEAGEDHKNLDTVQLIYEKLISLDFNRGDMLVALGGGVVGDITGFAAATYMRGIDYIQVPTTLLSQVDSSVGGKTGVDFNAYKNMVGAFYQPRLVYINMSLLKTLPARELSAGMGEVIKYGMIYDRDFYDFIKENPERILSLDYEALEHVIYTSCDIKRKVVSEDPTEQGIRAILNYGHTFGHAIEKLMNFSLLHGECVSIGMAGAAYISLERGAMTREEYEGLCKMLLAYKLPIGFSNLSNDDIMRIARHDKKATAGGIKFILTERIGKAYIDKSVTDEEYARALDNIRE